MRVIDGLLASYVDTILGVNVKSEGFEAGEIVGCSVVGELLGVEVVGGFVGAAVG